MVATSTAILLVGGAMFAGSMYMQQQALEQQKDAQAAYERRLNEATKLAEENAANFQLKLDELDQSFDPYKMDEAFASLYEGAIRPLEVDFDQNVLPEIRNAFNIGADGLALNSGTAARAEVEARRDLSFQKAALRMEERDKAITRAYTDYDRRINSLQLKANAQNNVINAKVGAASGMYGADSDVASATSAFGSSMISGAAGLGSAYVSGMNADASTKFVNAYASKNSSVPGVMSELSLYQGTSGGGRS